MYVSVYRDASGAVVWAGMSRSDERPDPLPPVPFDSWEVVVSSCNRRQALAVAHVLRRVYGLPHGAVGRSGRSVAIEVDGQWFPSTQAAAKALGVAQRTVSRALHEGYKLAGHTVRRAESRPECTDRANCEERPDCDETAGSGESDENPV